MSFLYRFFTVYFSFFFVLVFILMYPLFYFFLKIKPNFIVVFKLKRFFSKMMFLGYFSRLKIKNKENILENGNFILCSNHTSYLDIMAMYICINKPFLFMAKSELEKVPLFGIFFRTMDITVNRSSPISSARAFIRAKKELKGKFGIAIFPEATVNRNPPKLMVFKNGAFKLALESNTAILPIAFSNNYNIIGNVSKGKTRVFPGKTTASIMPAIHPKDYPSEKALKDATFAQIQEALAYE